MEQFQLADETLFKRVLNDDRHMLHSLLPPSRRHDYELIAKTRTLNFNNFMYVVQKQLLTYFLILY